MASAPRVAIVGGGLSGALCGLVLRSRGLVPTIFDAGRRRAGGRLAGGRHPDSGLQFLTASEPRLIGILGMLRNEGLIAPWTGRFGLLGTRGGGFLPSDVLKSTPIAQMAKEDGSATSSSSVDFCGFLSHHPETQPLYVGMPSNGDIVTGLCAAAGIETVLGAKIDAATCDAGAAKWRINQEDGGGFDAIVLASHDASLASNTVRALAAADAESEQRANELPQLLHLANALQAQRDERTRPSFTWSGYFPRGFSERVPFDAATVPGSTIVRFLARDASKPGRPATIAASEGEREGELWTAVATPEFAAEILARAAAITAESGDSERGGGAAAEAAAVMTSEVRRLFAPYFKEEGGGDAAPEPINASAKRWGAAFSSPTLGLAEDSVSLEPWRLAICGDYMRDDYASPAEAAALSGMDAAERVASWYVDPAASA